MCSGRSEAYIPWCRACRFRLPTVNHTDDITFTQNAKGLTLSIPMPGHSVAANLLETTRSQVVALEELIQGHDVVYLLMDSRESRWLPTMLGAKHRKVSSLKCESGAPPS